MPTPPTQPAPAPVQAGQPGPIVQAVPPHIPLAFAAKRAYRASQEAAACQCPCAGNCELALEGHLLAYDLVEGIRAAQSDVEQAYRHLLAYDLDVDDVHHVTRAREALARCLGARAGELTPAPMPEVAK